MFLSLQTISRLPPWAPMPLTLLAITPRVVESTKITSARSPLEGAVRLEVRDDGVDTANGPNVVTLEGSGLTGLRERVSELDGTLDIGAGAGGGFVLAVTVPLGGTLPDTSAAAGVQGKAQA